ncbi:hypothetical protein MLD38_033437 [Melastoma candidum]|uniref:Uncharacterized protein n=1 Tax=Melastoma candidum TaxID=119954 RepID=A0ACB9M7C0_9MYRT|nr:hypothetical protein MLD38_033437 [Melastoma candidum]
MATEMMAIFSLICLSSSVTAQVFDTRDYGGAQGSSFDITQDLHVENVLCGPGYGISGSSLGKYPGRDPVVGFYVKNCTLVARKNGVRIKMWPASFPGTVSEIRFENIYTNNVGNPVIIDQGYSPWSQCKKDAPSRVSISNVSFKNIYDTSSTADVVAVKCSSGVPCKNVEIGA